MDFSEVRWGRPRCTLAGFERSGHWPFLEEPQHFAQVLNDYLASLSASQE